VKAALHSHADDLLPFSISKTTKLKPVIHAVGDMGDTVPVWDIADKFGDDTTLLVTNMAQSRDLAGCLGCYRLALMRGHGFVCVGFSINDLVRLSVYIPRNARTQLAAMQMGEYKALSRGEIEARLKLDTESPAMRARLGAVGARGRLRPSVVGGSPDALRQAPVSRKSRFRTTSLPFC
jgi:HCOMODA/2-hydroxy-3-carboxy-muconic semialdehyde decarboxylase